MISEIRYCHDHVGNAAKLARAIKVPFNTDDIDRAAAEMAQFIPEGSLLVPAPSSTGDSKATLLLAQAIAVMVDGADVVDCIARVTPVPSSRILRLAGKPTPTIADHFNSMALSREPPADRLVVLIDNVVTSGATLQAMSMLLGDYECLAVVYTKAGKPRRKNPAEPIIRVCISGSRGYVHLDRVDQFISLLPDGTVILHGGSEGVDQRADEVARALGYEVIVYVPDWEKYKKAAGPIRNKAMVADADFLCAFWDGASRGTGSAIKAAVDGGVEYKVVLDDDA